MLYNIMKHSLWVLLGIMILAIVVSLFINPSMMEGLEMQEEADKAAEHKEVVDHALEDHSEEEAPEPVANDTQSEACAFNVSSCADLSVPRGCAKNGDKCKTENERCVPV